MFAPPLADVFPRAFSSSFLFFIVSSWHLLTRENIVNYDHACTNRENTIARHFAFRR